MVCVQATVSAHELKTWPLSGGASTRTATTRFAYRRETCLRNGKSQPLTRIPWFIRFRIVLLKDRQRHANAGAYPATGSTFLFLDFPAKIPVSIIAFAGLGLYLPLPY
jgi:hypothetical protein